ncbi:glycoside hydrolase family 18 protein [Trichoderma virens Gv29-8]|uniref:chitinase n=1 Tax=Hypocrea virens (strain Gv29-8 / FGSC 10586) TaxID=413071 RepID=G9N6F3_HYPVG|nr:glycoside hydrolase family 18 protein [Trichoderma virens Gv29-8]EHK17714.1 glycoside hydrolase family 18 protein [Trichoderma virens Gv29-8]
MRILHLVVLWGSLALSMTTASAFHGTNLPLNPCPADCYGSPENWHVYSSFDRLQICEQPLLLDFAIHTPLEDPNTTVKLRMCTLNDGLSQSNDFPFDGTEQFDPDSISYPVDGSLVSFDLFTSNEKGTATTNDLRNTIDLLQRQLTDSVYRNTDFLIAYSKGAVVAVYSGAAIDKTKTLPSVLHLFQEHLNTTASTKLPMNMRLQLCEEDRNGDHIIGVAINIAGNIPTVQETVQTWNKAACVNNTEEYSTKLKGIRIFEASAPKPIDSTNGNSGHLLARAQRANSCRTTTVAFGDSCGSLAKKCSISSADLSNLRPGQMICCSKGSLPDITPKPHPDGSCATYTIKPDDDCSRIAASNGLKIDQLEKFNDKTTWGWSGCKTPLVIGTNICLSKGTSPLPAPVSNAVCGPLVPGTKKPSAGQKLESLNPCPLNSCCNIWGQCGTTPDYCTPATGPTGNPGTAPRGKNGCISNCGVSIKNNAKPPSSFINVAYYESWNWDRPCLNYRAEDMRDTKYTHAHWAFASIDNNFQVTVNDTYKQLDDFLQLPQKRVLSFGGWGFSTSPTTYDKLRQAMYPEHVDKFVDSIVKYLNQKGFDGVDIDWEYPGAPDIRGIPAGLKSDGPNYLTFLKKLRSKLPASKSLSMAAPASYWYLKSFPIAAMSKLVDYIVYMTYDLHDQWDYDNHWTQDGCISGNCLRGHVNLTETMYALAMITKSGVDANKVVVGLPSYGRSFGMTNRAACEKSLNDPHCTFKGPNSTATPGECTGTAGYIANAEIEEIINMDFDDTRVDYDPVSDTTMVFYGSNWVAYMPAESKANRTAIYKAANLGGVVDWAVDLQEYTDDSLEPYDDELPDTDPLPPCNDVYNSMEELDAAAGNIPEHCVTLYTLTALNNLLKQSLSNYTDMLSNGYDDKFKVYSKSVADQAGSTLRDWITTNGTNYYTCEVAEAAICCDSCKRNQRRPSECDYCFDDDCFHYVHSGDFGPPTPVLRTKVYKESEPCPPDYSKRGYGPDDPYEQSVYWTFFNETGFFTDMESDTGIPKNKTKMGDYNRGNPCAPSSKPDDPCWASGIDYNVPLINGYSASDVANPKEIVRKGLENAQTLGPQIDSIIATLKLDGWIGEGSDLIDSLSMPIFMIASATEKMGLVETIADKIEEAKRKAFILEFLSAIFLFIPIVGEIIGSVAELADVVVIMGLIGAAGNAGMDIYTIVDDPHNAPLAIFDLILSPLALADVAKINKAANIRRGMKGDDVAKLGDGVKSRMETVEKVKGKCVSR